MRLGKELIGKPVYSLTDGRQLGNVKDIYLDLEFDLLNGIFLGTEGMFKRKARVIARENIAVFGYDAVLVTDSDVETDNNQTPEVELWLRRDGIQGRSIETAGGTKVGTVGDILFDEKARVVGFSLARVFVAGPIAEKQVVLREAVTNAGGKDGIMILDLTQAEKADEDVTKAEKTDEDVTKAEKTDEDVTKADEDQAEQPQPEADLPTSDPTKPAEQPADEA